MKSPSQLLEFTQVCMRLTTQHLPLPQLITLYCLKIKLGATDREFIDWLGEMPRLQQALGLRRLPHFTTVQKAFQRSSCDLASSCNGNGSAPPCKGYDDQS